MPDGDPFKFVKQGDQLSIPAARHNNWQRAAQFAASQGRTSPGDAGGSRDEGIILIKNEGTDDIDRFGVLGISGTLIDPADNLPEFQARWALTGVTPMAAHVGKFVIANEPIAKGKIGKAWVFGTCPVKISADDNNAKFLDVKIGDATMLAAGGTAQVLFASQTEDENGDYWAIVRLNSKSPNYGLLKTAWVPPSLTVKLTPCNPDGTVASPAPADIDALVYADGNPPVMFGGVAGETVYPYVMVSLPVGAFNVGYYAADAANPDDSNPLAFATPLLLPQSPVQITGATDGMVLQVGSDATRMTVDFLKITA